MRSMLTDGIALTSRFTPFGPGRLARSRAIVQRRQQPGSAPAQRVLQSGRNRPRDLPVLHRDHQGVGP